MESITPHASAKGTANQIPVVPKICGRTSMKTASNKNVLVNDIIADVFPSDNQSP